jgi:hypothetical protein
LLLKNTFDFAPEKQFVESGVLQQFEKDDLQLEPLLDVYGDAQLVNEDELLLDVVDIHFGFKNSNYN